MYCLASISATAPLIALSARSRSLGGGGASSAGGGLATASFFGAALAPATSTPSDVAHRVESEPEKRRRRALPRFLAQSRTRRHIITRVQQPQQKIANVAATSRPIVVAGSATVVAILFTRSNAPTEVAEGGGALTYSLDSSLVLDNDAELSAPEFTQFVGRVADVRVPADRRGATPFEETLDAWLGLQLVPACRKAVQARGGRWHTDA